MKFSNFYVYFFVINKDLVIRFNAAEMNSNCKVIEKLSKWYVSSINKNFCIEELFGIINLPSQNLKSPV